MRLDDRAPEVGDYWSWDIAEILERMTGDLRSIRDEAECCIRWDEGECECTVDDLWEITLEQRRDDDHYPLVLQSIREHGFTVPLTARRSIATENCGQVELGDGHHRIAAALELGLTEVPVLMTSPYDHVSADSWEWQDHPEPPEPGSITTRSGVTYTVPAAFTIR